MENQMSQYQNRCKTLEHDPNRCSPLPNHNPARKRGVRNFVYTLSYEYRFINLSFALVLVGAMQLFVSTIGCDMNAQTTSSIWTAIDQDDATAIAKIVKNGIDLNKVGLFTRQTPLEYALAKGKKDAFKALLEGGADPDFFLLSKQTVTFHCALRDDSYWLKQVLAHGADPNLWTRTHRNNAGTPLDATFGYNESPKSVENAKLLIDAGVELDSIISGRQNPLSLFAMNSGWKVVLYLLEKGADPHIGPEANVFFTHLQNPGNFLAKDPDFQAVEAKLVEMNLDVSKAKWNGTKWDIPNLR